MRDQSQAGVNRAAAAETGPGARSAGPAAQADAGIPGDASLRQADASLRAADASLRVAKAALRARQLAARAARSDADRADAGRLLRDAVLSLPEAQMAGTIAAYVSVGAEPATRSLIYAFWKRGAYVILPLLREDNDLDWASYEGPDSLGAGPHGLLEPTEPPRGTGAISSADLVIVPALAADGRGHRLGRGGGSYDRALARVGGPVPTITLLYDDELLTQIPAGSHDQRVRLAAQPAKGISRFP
jgi:5-formyltetrahydrofolate cyclo-ligase